MQEKVLQKKGTSLASYVSTGVGSALIAGAGMAGAAGLDVTGITTALSDAGTAIGTVAAAMLLVAGAGMAVKWLLGFVFS
jgi:hypothetical protein